MEIPKSNILEEKVFTIVNDEQFNQIALEVYNYQYLNNIVYRHYCELLKKDPINVRTIGDIPFLPISFFKTHEVKTGKWEPEMVFTSSGTTAINTSKHYIKDSTLYEKSFLGYFEQVYGKVEGLCILGLLPSYLEREGSSLVFMINKLIQLSKHEKSGFYLYDHATLKETLISTEAIHQETILFGVTYALLDFAEVYSFPLKHTIMIETGGMKGRKEEMTKEELYSKLKESFGLPHLDAEYGMTELLSQAYGRDGIYICPPWMKVLFRDETDPLSVNVTSGAINIIDLANIHSCSFIATDDLGKSIQENTFSILGRIDNSDIRGCSLLIS